MTPMVKVDNFQFISRTISSLMFKGDIWQKLKRKNILNSIINYFIYIYKDTRVKVNIFWVTEKTEINEKQSRHMKNL